MSKDGKASGGRRLLRKGAPPPIHIATSESPNKPVTGQPQPSPKHAESENPSRSELKLQHRQSRMSLFSLFSRPKVEKARGHHEGGPVPIVEELAPIEPMRSPTKSKRSTRQLARADSHHGKPAPAVDAATGPPAPERSSRGSVSKKPATSSSWDPPPLFQVYPQAIKHGRVRASVVSAETIIRLHQHKRQGSVTDASRDDLSAGPEKGKSDKSAQRMPTAMSNGAASFTEKIFVLVTSGYVLQYAGEGSSSRMPEKLLRLSKESAAFVCDLIPGQHYVLQISQSTDGEGAAPPSQPKSLLSRLRLSGSRKSVSSFLLVLDCAADMDAWLAAVRKHIEDLGGMKQRPDESVRPAEQPRATRAEAQEGSLSHRYSVKRDRDFLVGSALDAPLDSPTIVGPDWGGASRDSHDASLAPSESGSTRSSNRKSVRQSLEVSSLANTLNSMDQSQLSRSWESSRLSTMSTTTNGSGTVTMATSRGSSPAPASPQLDGEMKREAEPPARKPSTLRSFHMNPAPAPNHWRRSVQALPTTDEDLGAAAAAGRPQTFPKRHSSFAPIGGRGQPNGPPFYVPARTRSRANYSPQKPDPLPRCSSVPPPSGPLPPLPGADGAGVAARRPQSTLVTSASYSSLLAPLECQRESLHEIEEQDSETKQRGGTVGTAWTADSTPELTPDRTPPRRSETASPNFSRPNRMSVSRPSLLAESALSRPASRASSGGPPRALLRQIPVRPATDTGSNLVPRRHASLQTLSTVVPAAAAAPQSATGRSSPGSSSPGSAVSNQSAQAQLQGRNLRRPTSVQVRPSSAAFLSSSRNYTPATAGKRSSSASATSATSTPPLTSSSTVAPSPSPFSPLSPPVLRGSTLEPGIVLSGIDTATIATATAVTVVAPARWHPRTTPTPPPAFKAPPAPQRSSSQFVLQSPPMRARRSAPCLVQLPPPMPPPSAPLPVPPPAQQQQISV